MAMLLLSSTLPAGCKKVLRIQRSSDDEISSKRDVSWTKREFDFLRGDE